MCNWFQNKSPTHIFAVDCDTRHGNWAAPCYFNGASPTGSARWGYCLQRHLACEGLYMLNNEWHPGWSILQHILRNIHTVRALLFYYSDVIMSSMASQMTSFSNVCSTVCSGADQRKHQGSASVAFLRGIHLWPVVSPHKGPVTQKMFPFDDVIMLLS